jgi:hypothetical protein
MTTQYFFQLGSTPALSLSELEAFFPSQSWERVTTYFVSSAFENELDHKTLLYHLGGTVKLLKKVGELPLGSTEDEIFEFLAEHLITSTTDSKLNYAVAEHGRDHLPALNPAFLKPLLKQRNINARYRDGSRSGLSAAILLHHSNVHELNLIQTATTIQVAETVAVQDIDEWSFRDREKPYADRKKGMLPPKVARVMVNLGLGLWKKENPDKPIEPVIYDPFCGTGTVVMEAALAECPIIASDADGIAVHGTKKNLEWLEHHYKTEHSAAVLPGDVASIQPKLLPSKVDVIVTEPFLGKPTPNPANIDNIKRGLEKLYWGAFRNWTKILNDTAHVVMVLPVWSAQQSEKDQDAEAILEKTWGDFLDKIEKLGYTTVSKPILYHRPQALVQRLICQFTFKNNTTAV